MKTGQPCPLVLIEWEDSEQPAPAWSHLSDFQLRAPIKCASVGWLIQDDAQTKALAPNMGAIDNEQQVQASGIIRIPTRAVTKMKVLRETAIYGDRRPSSHLDQGRKPKRS